MLAVVDWELSTLGHPFGDLSYNCLSYHSPLNGLLNCSPEEMRGIPTEEEYVQQYCERSGISVSPKTWGFYMAYCLFRIAAIAQGVYARSLQGNASSVHARFYGSAVPELARVGWKYAQLYSSRL